MLPVFWALRLLVYYKFSYPKTYIVKNSGMAAKVRNGRMVV